MAANLKGRLSRLRAAGPRGSSPGDAAKEPSCAGDDSLANAAGASPRSRPDFLEGWDEAADFVWTRSLDYPNPLPASVDPAPFAPLRRASLRSMGALTRGEDERDAAPVSRIASEDLRFFDLETTGLSGGAGTIAFLASIGRVEAEGGFCITQVFLADFPGEHSFVGIVLGLLGEGKVVASYNGKAFDIPLLRTRCVMTGFTPPAYGQIDALYASRRLWRSVIGDASLGSIESEVLHIDRGPDLPGAMIPEVWLSFAKGTGAPNEATPSTEATPLMGLVLSHNASDVLALAHVVSRIASIFESPLDYVEDAAAAPRAATPLDRAGLGRGLIAIGRPGEGEALLESAARSCDGRAALLLFRRYRLSSRTEKAVAMAGLLPESYSASVELAKLYERGGLDLEIAARYAKQVLDLAPTEGLREAAAKRVARIAAKLSRSG